MFHQPLPPETCLQPAGWRPAMLRLLQQSIPHEMPSSASDGNPRGKLEMSGVRRGGNEEDVQVRRLHSLQGYGRLWKVPVLSRQTQIRRQKPPSTDVYQTEVPIYEVRQARWLNPDDNLDYFEKEGLRGEEEKTLGRRIARLILHAEYSQDGKGPSRERISSRYSQQ